MTRRSRRYFAAKKWLKIFGPPDDLFDEGQEDDEIIGWGCVWCHQDEEGPGSCEYCGCELEPIYF